MNIYISILSRDVSAISLALSFREHYHLHCLFESTAFLLALHLIGLLKEFKDHVTCSVLERQF
jgi:hypothetical protein